MTSEFKDFPQNSRVWIYQSNRSFSIEEKKAIENDLLDFTIGWQSHGTPLKAEARIFYDRFLVFAVDENMHQASGCSIDKSVHLIKNLEDKYNIKLLDRTFVIYRKDQVLKETPFTNIKNLLTKGELNPETIVFNNTISTLEEFRHNWEIPINKSWVSRYINN